MNRTRLASPVASALLAAFGLAAGTIPNVAVPAEARAAPPTGFILLGAGLLLTAVTALTPTPARRRR